MNDIVVYRASIFVGDSSLSLSRDTELIKTKGHHLQTRRSPKASISLPMQAKELHNNLKIQRLLAAGRSN